MINKNTKFLIVGLGLIGGSYASSLSQSGYQVGAIDVNQSSIDFALKNNLIAHGSTKVQPEYLAQFDVIIFALYPNQFIQWITDYQKYLKKDALITDVTGVKQSVVYKVQSLIDQNKEFISAHPMAGKAVSGVQNASSQIFKGANYIITPTNKNTQNAIETSKELASILGFEKVSVISPEEHDEIIGFLSQLTHCIAVSLMNCEHKIELADFTGDSFRDLTRIANINDVMWSELFLLNKETLVEQIDKFSATLEQFKNYIKNEDVSGMRQMMQKSTMERKRFDKK